MRTPVSVKSKKATAATEHTTITPMAATARTAIFRMLTVDALRRGLLLVVAFAILYMAAKIGKCEHFFINL